MIKLNGFEVNVGKFPNGESYADISMDWLNREENKIVLKFESDEDLIFLQFVYDFVVENYPLVPVTLNIPYFPYSRMDRQEENRLFTLKSVTRMINNMGFASVSIMEPHSEVSVALLDRVKVTNKSAELALQAMRDVLGLVGSCWFNDDWYSDKDYNLRGLFEKAREAGVYYVYPDAGAEKRYRKQIKYDKVITCSKERDFNTGNITSIELNGADKITDCKIAIIVDDLSSKGGTFLGTAKKLREELNVEHIILVVAHCENTIYEGNVLSGIEIDKVYTTNSIIREPGFKEVTNFNKSKLVVEQVI